MDKKDDIYLAMLTYGYERIETGITQGQMMKYLLENDYIEALKENYQIEYSNETLDMTILNSNQRMSEIISNQFIAPWDAYFKDMGSLNARGYEIYMKHIELKEAREASLKAQKSSTWALRISIWTL